MHRILAVLTVILLPSLAWSGAYQCRTTGASPLWTDPAAWSDCNGTYPDNTGTDTYSAVLNDGHSVTIPAGSAITLGHDGGTGSVALASAGIHGTGVLTVNGLLQLRGHVQQGNATWAVNAGGVVEGYSATDDAAHRYQWQIGMAAGQANSYLVLAGTGRGSGRVTVRTAAGSATRWGGFTNGATAANRATQTIFTGGYTGAGKIKANFVRFENIGDSANHYHGIIVNAATIGTGDATWFEDCIFDGCSPVFIAMGPRSIVRIKRTSFLNPVANALTPFDQSFILVQTKDAGGPDPTGQREIWDNAIQGSVLFSYLVGMDLRRNVFVTGSYGTMIQGNGSVPNPSVFLDNILAKTNSVTVPNITPLPVNTDTETRTVVLQTGYATDDFFRLISASGQNGAMHFNGYVIEREQGVPHERLAGAVWVIVTTVPGTTLTFRNVLNVPVWTGGVPAAPSAALVVPVTTTSFLLDKLTISNVTWVTDYINNKFGIFGFEIPSGETGGTRKAELKNILATNYSTSTGKLLYTTGTDVTDGTFSVHHNAIYNFAADPYLGRNITAADFSGIIGANDMVGPPRTIGAPAGHFLAWMQQVDPDAGVTTLNGAINRLLTKNDDTGGTAVDHTRYYDWIRAAYQPPPGQLGTAGIADDGITATHIGAVPPDPSFPAITFSADKPAAGVGTVTYSLTATDASGVTGYYALGSDAPCSTLSVAGASFSATPPSRWTFESFSPATKYLCAWVTNVAGKTSVAEITVVLTPPPDTTAPALTTFSLPASSTLPAAVPVTLTATDAVGVSAYLLSDTLTGATISTPGWVAIPAAPQTWTGSDITYTFSGAGTHTLSAWVRDAAGNISSRSSATTTITDPAPAITTTTLTGPSSVPYSRSLSATGGTPPYTWSLAPGSTLPTGLTLSAAGVISGIPTVTGDFTITVQVTDINLHVGTATVTLSLTSGLLTMAAPATTTGSTASFCSFSFKVTGGVAPYSWSVAAGALPPGLGLNTATGTVSGTPAAGGVFTFTIAARDSQTPAETAGRSVTLTIAVPPLAVATASLPPGAVNSVYPATILAGTGGIKPYLWSLIAGTLPPGLGLNSGTGAISGIPLQAGSYPVTVRLEDHAGTPPVTKEFSIIISATPLGITTASLPGGAVGTAYATTLAATGGAKPYFWSIPAGKLPPGLSLNNVTGALTGTPTGAGSYPIEVKIEDYIGSAVATRNLEIVVTTTPLAISTTTLPTQTVGTAASATLTGTGGIKPYSWSMVAGPLPPGLSLVSNTGVISGTPLAEGSYPFTVRLQDAAGAAPVTRALTITTTAAPLSITTATLTAASTTASYSTPLAATGGVRPYTWSVSSGILPPGIGINTATGILSGKPAATGSYSFTVRLADARNPAATVTRELTLTVN